MLDSDLEFSNNIQLATEGIKKKDLFYELETELRRPETISQIARFREKVKQWLQIKDPWLLESQGFLILANSAGRDNGDMWFEGKYYPVSEYSKVSKAWYLVPCAFGYVCDQNDFRLASACIDKDFCYSSRFEYVQQTLPENEISDYQVILNYYNRFVAAIQRQDIDAFVKPDGVP